MVIQLTVVGTLTCASSLSGVLAQCVDTDIDSTVKDSSVVAVQIFDQRKFKRKVSLVGHLTLCTLKLMVQTDQGFLGVINVKVTDVIDLELGGQGES